MTAPPADRRAARAAILGRFSPALILLLAAALRLPALDVLPPGLHFDEAVYGLMGEQIRAGARPVFFSAYTGREPLYMYVLALTFAAVGPSAWAIRLTSAWIGLLTVALLFALGRALYGRRVGLVAAALGAVVMWPLLVQRNGYPNVLIPPIEAAAAFWLWRGWSAGRKRDFVVGGALSGLVLYTYLAARFWPVFLLLFVGYAAIVEPRRRRRRSAGIALAVAAATLVFAPLGLHFLQHPADFVERAGQVLLASEGGARGQMVGSLATNMGRSALGLVWPLAGDPRWHFNLPGRPVFGLAAAIALPLGALRCLRGSRDPRFALPLLWALVLALPGVLTDEMQPAGQRIFGAWPALALLVALGLSTAARWMSIPVRRFASPPPSRAIARDSGSRASTPSSAGHQTTLFVLLSLCIVGHELWRTSRDYPAWASMAETRAVYDSSMVHMARQAAAESTPDRLVLLARHWHHATVAFLTPEVVDRARWADPRLALPVSTGQDELAGLVVLLPSDLAPEALHATAWLDAHATHALCLVPRAAQALPAAAPDPGDRGPSRISMGANVAEALVPSPRDHCHGRVDAVLRYQLAPAEPRERPSPRPSPVDGGGAGTRDAAGGGSVGDPDALEVEIGGEIVARVTGALRHADRSEPLVVPVDWRVIHPPEGPDRGLALHLVDASGTVVAQADDAGYLAVEWRVGDQVRQWFTLELDRSIPPGDYEARLMVVDAAGRRLPVRREEGVADALTVGRVSLGRDGRARADEGQPARVVFGAESQEEVRAEDGGGLAVLRAEVGSESLRPGDTLPVEVLWARAGATPVASDARELVIEAALAGESGQALGCAAEPAFTLSRAPIARGYPPSEWARRELLYGRYRLPLPTELPDGRLALRLRLPGLEGTLPLGVLPVDRIVRRFEPPSSMARALAARFDAGTTLLGLDLDPKSLEAGRPFDVVLWWRADRALERRWTVFVHLDDPSGALWAQSDGEPVAGDRPTDGWQTGEIVADRHHLLAPDGLPAGDFVLGVGLYDPLTGGRAPAFTRDGEPVPEAKFRVAVRVH